MKRSWAWPPRQLYVCPLLACFLGDQWHRITRHDACCLCVRNTLKAFASAQHVCICAFALHTLSFLIEKWVNWLCLCGLPESLLRWVGRYSTIKVLVCLQRQFGHPHCRACCHTLFHDSISVIQCRLGSFQLAILNLTIQTILTWRIHSLSVVCVPNHADLLAEKCPFS